VADRSGTAIGWARAEEGRATKYPPQREVNDVLIWILVFAASVLVRYAKTAVVLF
jgi:hypothetical protein